MVLKKEVTGLTMRKNKVLMRRETHRDGERINKERTWMEQGWEGRRTKPCMRNVEHSHRRWIGVTSAPSFCTAVWGYFQASFNPVWQKIDAIFVLPLRKQQGHACVGGSFECEGAPSVGAPRFGVPTLCTGQLLSGGSSRAFNAE